MHRRVGHASISTTLNIYTHTIPASHREAVDAVEERLFVVPHLAPSWATGSQTLRQQVTL